MRSHYKGADGLKTALSDFQADVVKDSKAKAVILNGFVQDNSSITPYNSSPKGKTRGQLRRSIVTNSKPKKGIVRAKTPYARYIYYGSNLHWTTPGTTDHFFEKTWDKNNGKYKQQYIKYMQSKI